MGKIASKVTEKMKACLNKSTNVSINDERQTILVKNPDKVIDILYRKKALTN